MTSLLAVLLQVATACSPVLTAPTEPPMIYRGLCDWSDLNLPSGTYTIKAVAVDKAGNVQTSTVTIRIETVTITAPPAGAVVTGNRVNISAAAPAAAGIVRMELKVNGVSQRVWTNQSSFTYSWNSNPYKRSTATLEVTATNKAGQTATSRIRVNVE